MLDADKAGLQLTVHAIGDEANSVLLDYLEELDRRLDLGAKPLESPAHSERQLGETVLRGGARLIEAAVEPDPVEVAAERAAQERQAAADERPREPPLAVRCPRRDRVEDLDPAPRGEGLRREVGVSERDVQPNHPRRVGIP